METTEAQQTVTRTETTGLPEEFDRKSSCGERRGNPFFGLVVSVSVGHCGATPARDWWSCGGGGLARGAPPTSLTSVAGPARHIVRGASLRARTLSPTDMLTSTASGGATCAMAGALAGRRVRGVRARVAPWRSASSSGPNRRGRVSTTPRAGWSDFADAVRREVEITFNPRTRGAKIAGRCPDTQERPTEVSRAEEERQFEDVDEGFDLQSFTAQLEAQLEAQNAAASTVDAAEEKVNAELVQRLAEVADGYSAAGAAGELAAIDPDAAPIAVGELAKSERQMELERAYYGADYVGEGPLTGRELALLCYGKYGKYHDMAVKHVRMGEGMKRWVSLNLYVGHLGQRSYPATEETYVAQLDSIAYMITGWGQADYCRAFFREPPIARRGLPSRPRVDTCVTLQFNRSPTWDDELGDEYFTY